MTMGKDGRIVQVESGLGYGERTRESGGGLSGAREGRKGKSRMVQWVRTIMYLIDKHLHLIIVHVRLCGTVLVSFP